MFAAELCDVQYRIARGQLPRAGPQVITDPSFHVTRNMEDFITWVDSSKIRRKVMKFNDALDDFDLLQVYRCLETTMTGL